MSYDPVTGVYKEENDSVAQRVTGLMSKQNPLMKQAVTMGKQGAARRGLMNSSMGIQAGQAEAYRVALPIASQEASQTSQKNMLGRQMQGSDIQQKRDITSREGMQQTDIAARRTELEMELAQRNSALSAQIGSNESIANKQIGNQQFLSQLDRDAQERINSMNIASNNRNSAMSAALNIETSYSSQVQSIMNNPDLPPESRQSYLDHAVKMRDSNLALVEQMYSIQLSWGAGSGGATTPPAPGAQENSYEIENRNMDIYSAAKRAGLSPEQVAQSYKTPINEINGWLADRGLSL